MVIGFSNPSPEDSIRPSRAEIFRLNVHQDFILGYYRLFPPGGFALIAPLLYPIRTAGRDCIPDIGRLRLAGQSTGTADCSIQATAKCWRARIASFSTLPHQLCRTDLIASHVAQAPSRHSRSASRFERFHLYRRLSVATSPPVFSRWSFRPKETAVPKT